MPFMGAKNDAVTIICRERCKEVVKKVKEMLGGGACGRRIHEISKTGSCTLKEPVLAYNDVFEGKMGLLSSENRLVWDIYPDI
jgi:hypothetical protein